MRRSWIRGLGLVVLWAACLIAVSACVRRSASMPSSGPQTPIRTVGVSAAGPVVVVDSVIGCEGDGYRRSASWERHGEWLVHGDRKVPAGVAARLRELASEAQDVEGPLPPELGITAEALEERTNDIIEAVEEWYPWLEALEDPWGAVTLERVLAAARDQFIDPNMTTVTTLLEVTVPGEPQVVLTSRSAQPYAQPWEVRIGAAPARTVTSLEISRYVQLLIEPDSPAAATLEGAAYWRQQFWNDKQLWSDVFGEPWTKRHAREMCAEIDGWDEVSAAWGIQRADIGDINGQPLSLQPVLIARKDQLVSSVRWWNRLDEDYDPVHDWDVFLDMHALVTEAAARMPCLAAWKAAGPKRVISLDAVGDQGHNERLAKTYHEPVWRHSGLAGSPDYVLFLRIDGDGVGTLLLGHESDGAVVLRGHASLTGSFTDRFHPSDGAYAILRPDGTTEKRRMPAED